MRISDWSSDVGSSDLTAQGSQEGRPAQGREESPGQEGPAQGRKKEVTSLSPSPAKRERGWGEGPALRPLPQQHAHPHQAPQTRTPGTASWPSRSKRKSPDTPSSRSEEHMSELQSLMRISYAVLCLKKKKT